MESKSSQRIRISQLDGLRGISIILVVLNHLHSLPLYEHLPQFWHPVLNVLTGNGKIGVCFLFMISGFLMASFYPRIRSYWSFLQKRYTRIFPAFLVMATIISATRFFSASLTFFQTVTITLLCVSIVGILWRLFQRIPNRKILGKFLFFGFLAFQITMILVYVFYIQGIAPSIVYTVWPQWKQALCTYLVNITMIVPFGSYFGQTDGVYWSVFAEILFYILYPLIVIPTLSISSTMKRAWQRVAVLIFSIIACYGLWILSTHLFQFRMLQMYLFVNFMVGAVLGYFPNNSIKSFIGKILHSPVQVPFVVFMFLTVFSLPVIQDGMSIEYAVRMIAWVIPIAIVFMTTLHEKNVFTKLMDWKPLRTIGVYSYAVYLTHSFAIEIVAHVIDPQDISMWVQKTGLTVGIIVLFATAVHFFLELPYFQKSKVLEKNTSSQQTAFWAVKLPYVFAGMLMTVWIAYRSPIAVAALSVNHGKTSTMIQPIQATPHKVSFVAKYNNLGMLVFSVRPLASEELVRFGITPGRDSGEDLVIAMKDENGTVVAQHEYPLHQLYDSQFHPFGFPIISDAKGKTFSIELSISSDDAVQIIGLDASNSTMRSIYFFNKSALLQHPIELFSFIANKITQPFREPLALRTFGYLLPLWVLLALQSIQNKKQKAE